MGGERHTLGKLQKEIRRHLGEILQFEVRDPRLAWVTVMDVKLSRDLRHATVYVTTLEEGAALEETLLVLRRDRGFLRSALAQRLRLRRVPELRFEPDLLALRAQRIEAILAEVPKPPTETENEPKPHDAKPQASRGEG